MPEVHKTTYGGTTMYNMKVSKKLFLSFAIILILTAALGITAIISLLNVDKSYSEAYENTATPLPIISEIVENIGNTRLEVGCPQSLYQVQS